MRAIHGPWKWPAIQAGMRAGISGAFATFRLTLGIDFEIFRCLVDIMYTCIDRAKPEHQGARDLEGADEILTAK